VIPPATPRRRFSPDFLADVKFYWETEGRVFEEHFLEIIMPLYHGEFILRPPFGDLHVRNAIAFSWMAKPPTGVIVYTPAHRQTPLIERQTTLRKLLHDRFGKPQTSRDELFGPKDNPFVSETDAKAAYLASLGGFPEDIRREAWEEHLYALRTACDQLRVMDAVRQRDDPSGSLVRYCELFPAGNVPFGLNRRDQTIYLVARHAEPVH
jgi:hypothetical protein